MSYAICRMQKISNAKNIVGVQLHNRRERNHSNTNPDIDFSSSNKNYTLLESKPNMTFNQIIDEKLKQNYKGKKAIRKDAVKMCELLFTSDNNFFQNISAEKQREYFEDCFQFACNRYGKDNIISAIVHLDEHTPHLHIDFIPLTTDGRLSAKSLFGGKTALQQLQDDFFKIVGTKYNLERGKRADLENPEYQTTKHLTTSQYKAKMVNEQVIQAEQQLSELKGKVLELQEVQKIQGKKSFTGALKNITYKEFLDLKATAEKVDEVDDKLSEINFKLDELKQKQQKLNENTIALKQKETEIQKKIEELSNIEATVETTLKQHFEQIKQQKFEEIKSELDLYIKSVNEFCEKKVKQEYIESSLNFQKRVFKENLGIKQLNLLKRAFKIPLEIENYHQLTKYLKDNFNIEKGTSIKFQRLSKDIAKISDNLSSIIVNISEQHTDETIKILCKEFVITPEQAKTITEKCRKLSISKENNKDTQKFISTIKKTQPNNARFSLSDLQSPNYAPKSNLTSEQEQQINRKRGRSR